MNEYDAERLVKVTNSAGNTTELELDGNGNAELTTSTEQAPRGP